MHVSRNSARGRIRQNVTIDVYNFEHVQTFKYLGAVQEEIKQRITQANKCTFAVQTLLKSKFITRKAKTGIYQTMI